MANATIIKSSNRDLILELLTEECLCKTELQQIIGLSWGTVTHHLQKLETANAVFSLCYMGRTYYVTNPCLSRSSCIKQVPLVHKILGSLADGPAGPSDVARAVDCQPGIASRHLKALELEGIVERDRSYHPRFWVKFAQTPKPRSLHQAS